MKFTVKSLLIGGFAFALASCASDDISTSNPGNGNVDVEDNVLNTASVLIGQWGQSRATNVDTWSITKTRSFENWKDKLDFNIPANAIDISETKDYNQNDILVVPAGVTVSDQLNNNFSGTLYIAGTYNPQTLGNNSNNIVIYILEDGELTFDWINNNNGIIINAGTVNFNQGLDGSKIKEIYNVGELNFGNQNTWHNLSNDVSIYSEGGMITFFGQGVSFMSEAEINSQVYFDVNQLTFQSNTSKTICSIEFNGTIEVPDNGLIVSHIKAKELKFNGHTINLLPNAMIDVETLRMETNANNDRLIGYEGSTGIVKAKDIYFNNGCGFETSFSPNINFQITGTVYNNFNGSKSWSISDYLEQEAGENLKARFISGEIEYTPSCGIVEEENPTPDPEPTPLPTLELITSVEAPTHDHDSDKENGRHLSATSIDWDGNTNTIYVSYHMRGTNWGNDSYDKDDTEGCIETWKFNTTEDSQTEIQLGKYMWTNEFDFNHLIIDGSDIVTVGSMEKKGAIIGKIPNTFANFELTDDDQNTYSADLTYKVLTTDVKLYGDYENESGNVTNQFIDYEEAGDGNCLIKVGNEYYVATYKGYGIVDATTLKTKKENGTPVFVSTPGSAKHIINNNGEIAVLYLNSRPETNAAENRSDATLATFSTTGFPYDPTTTTLQSFIQPVDGKNVLANFNGNYFACMGKGGLNIANQIYNFGEDGEEPVNGIDIDSDFIYLAVGGHLRVLDVNNPANEIASYHLPNMSSNFVKVVNYSGEKYIIVAYGQAGVKVFRLKNV